jgi:hypothetical protein
MSKNTNTKLGKQLNYLNSTVILVVGKAERAKSTTHTIQTIHVAFTLV